MIRKLIFLFLGFALLTACTDKNLSQYVDAKIIPGHTTGDGSVFFTLSMASVPDENGLEYKGEGLPELLLSIQVDGVEVKTEVKTFYISENILVQVPGDQLEALQAKEVTFCVYDVDHDEFLDHDSSNNCLTTTP